MIDVIKNFFRTKGPLSPDRIHRELLGKSEHNKPIIHGDKDAFEDMNIYYFNRKKYTGTQIVYLHGGAYLHGLNPLHFKFCYGISKALKLPVTLLDYPLLPDEDHQRAYEKVLHYISKLDEYYLIGDSAGGGLALGCLLYNQLNSKVIPKKTVLISPWVDVTMSNPEMDVYDDIDFILDRATLKELGELWAHHKPADHYLVSPIYGPVKDLRNVFVISGSNELFTPDLRLLGSKLNNFTSKYLEGKNMFHDYPLFFKMGIPEADKAFDQIIEFLKY